MISPSKLPAANRPPLWIIALAMSLLVTTLPAAPVFAQSSPEEATTAAAKRSDDALRSLISAAGGSDEHPEADIVVVLDHSEVDVEASGLSHVVERRVTKLLTTAGCRDQASLRFDYDPASQLIEIRRVRIHRNDGSFVDIDATQAVDVTAPAHAIYWGARMQVLALPQLRIGDAIEIETYRKGFVIAYLDDTAGEDERYIPPMRGHYYDVVLFQGGAPVIDKTYTLRTPRDKPLQYAIYNGAVFASTTFDADHFTYRFWQRDMPAAEREWRSSGTSDYVPKVVMATVQDWGEKSRWFFEVNEQQFDATPEIAAKVAELIEGKQSEEEKIAAINHWVAQEIRYCGLSMGEGEGYTLHPGDMIFNERSGVCKDIAGMSITMLRAAGMEVYPAMTMAGSRVESIPADQFNHCVGAVRLADGSFKMIDPTWIPFSMYDWSRAEGEQHYVIGTPEGEELAMTRAYTPQENEVKMTLRGNIEPDGSLVGSLQIAAVGYADTRLRRALGNSAQDGIVAGMEHWLAALAPGAELLDYSSGDPVDFSRPLPLELKFRLPGYAVMGKTTASWQPLCPQLLMANYAGLFRFAEHDLPTERETPALIWYAQEVTIDEEITLPKDFRAQPAAGAWQVGTAEEFAACLLTLAPEGKKMRLSGSIHVQNRYVPVAQWPAFQAAVKMVENLGAARLVAVRKGA